MGPTEGPSAKYRLMKASIWFSLHLSQGQVSVPFAGRGDLTIFICFLPPCLKEESLLEILWIWMLTPPLKLGVRTWVSLPLWAGFIVCEIGILEEKKWCEAQWPQFLGCIYIYAYNLPPHQGSPWVLWDVADNFCNSTLRKTNTHAFL